MLLLGELGVAVLELPLPGDGAEARCLEGGLALQGDREQLPLVAHGGEDAAVLVEDLVNGFQPFLAQTWNMVVTLLDPIGFPSVLGILSVSVCLSFQITHPISSYPRKPKLIQMNRSEPKET